MILNCHWTRGMLYTVGVQEIADRHGAYWLIDCVASYQHDPRAKAEEFQVWTLLVGENRTALLTMTDGDSVRPIIDQVIDYTDFPTKATVKLYCCHGGGEPPVLMTPEEY